MKSTASPKTLRVLAHLLSYPDTTLRSHLGELRDALHDERALSAGRLIELDALMDRLRSGQAMDVESAYVELFDRGHGRRLRRGRLRHPAPGGWPGG